MTTNQNDWELPGNFLNENVRVQLSIPMGVQGPDGKPAIMFPHVDGVLKQDMKGAIALEVPNRGLVVMPKHTIQDVTLLSKITTFPAGIVTSLRGPKG